MSNLCSRQHYNVLESTRKVPDIFSDFNQVFSFSTLSLKIQLQISPSPRKPVGAALINADGRT